MRFKVYSIRQHPNNVPTYDDQGRQNGTKEVLMLEVIAIPDGDSPQTACCRLHCQFFDPDDATILRYRSGAVFEADAITSEAGAQANAALDAAREAAVKAAAANDAEPAP